MHCALFPNFAHKHTHAHTHKPSPVLDRLISLLPSLPSLPSFPSPFPPPLSCAKGVDNPKMAERQSKAVADMLSKGNAHRMPFAWAARPVFTSRCDLDTRSRFSPLFKQDLEKLRDEDVLRALTEYHRITAKASTQGRVRFTTIPGEFGASVEPYKANFPTVTPTLLPVAPYPDKELAPRKEVLPFFPQPVHHAHLAYCDLLFLYPRSINFAGKRISKSSNARNILCRVAVLPTDELPLRQDPEGLPIVFGRANTKRLVTYAETTVLYHARQPVFSEEIKIAVPPTVSASHHVLFTFYHVSVKDKKKSKARVRLGHAVLPLSLALAHARTRAELCVAAGGSGGGGGGGLADGDLPGRYTQHIAVDSKEPREVSQACECTQTATAGLRWLDDGKPLFTVEARSYSTVRHHDEHLRRFFDKVASHDRSPRSDTDVSNAIKALRAVHDDALYGYLPVIFNQLLELIPTGPGDAGDDVTLNVITYLLHAVHHIHGGSRERSTLVWQYVEHVFRTSFNATTQRSVHDGIAHQLLSVLKDSAHRTHVLQYAWFFLRLISKSMTQVLSFTRSKTVPRHKRFSQVRADLLSMVVYV